MTWLLEEPLAIGLAGLVAGACAVAITARQGRNAMLAAIGITTLVTLLLLVFERWVVTDVEKVEAELASLVVALEANDKLAVLDHLSSAGPLFRRQAKRYLDRVRVRQARVGSDLKIVINQLTIPPSATARFLGRVTFNDAQGTTGYQNLVQRFTLHYRQQEDRWRIVRYEHGE